MLATTMGTFALRSFRLDDDLRSVVAVGDLTLRAAPVLKHTLLEQVEHPGHLIVDLTRVVAFDATTLGILVGIYARLDAAGGRLTVVCGSRLRSALRLTALDEIFGVESTVAAAVQHVPVVADDRLALQS